MQAVVARDGDERAHLHHGVEGDGTAVLAAGDVDLGLRDRIELGVDHGAGVEVRQRLAQCLGAQRAGTTHARLEDLARHLARPEARHTHLTGERAHDVTERAIELGLVDLHAQADEVPFHRLCSGTHHEPVMLPVASRGGRTALQNMKFIAPRTVRPTAASPSRPMPPAASTCSAVARPQPSRTKSMLDSDSVDRRVHLVAHPPGPPTLDDDGERARVAAGARDVEADRGALGAARLLADDEGHGALDPVQRQGRGTVPAPAGAVEGATGVLLVHPAVEDPHLHERRRGAPRPTGLQPTAAHSSSPRASSWARRVRGHLVELVVDGRAGERPAHRDPPLVAGGEIVLHMVTERAVPRRLGLAHDGPLDPDEVGELVLDVPAGALGGQAPLGRGQLVGDVGQVAPRLGPAPLWPSAPVAANHRPDLRCRPASHRPYPPARACGIPGRCLWPGDHPPFLVTLPLRSSPVQGHHRPEELPWLTTRGTA